MQSKENAWTYLALKQAMEMALQLLHPVTGYWFWRKKQWPRWFWPLFLASSCFLLFSFPPSLFCFLFPFFSFHTNEQKLLFSFHSNEQKWPRWLFFCSFLSVFLFFYLLFLSAPVRSLEGLIYSLNISLFRKDSMH